MINFSLIPTDIRYKNFKISRYNYSNCNYQTFKSSFCIRRLHFPSLIMCKTAGILILSLFAILGVDSQDPITIRSADYKQNDADLLDSISWQEALPVVLFETNDGQLLLYPTALEKARIKNGRLIAGTEFVKPTETQVVFSQAPTPRSQLFFCPNPGMDNKCLIPKDFGESGILQCDNEPVPVIEEIPRTPKCGVSGNGTMMRFDFKICEPKEPFKFGSRNIAPYSFCYDIPTKKIVYVDYNISSVNLIFEKLLVREREITSELNQNSNETIGSQYFTYLDNLRKTKPQYQFQYLVPTDNMALATWRKITYQYENIALQHGKLFKLWDDINSYIRTDALESARSPRRILTGVFEIPHGISATNTDTDHMHDFWITMVVNMNENSMNGKIVLNPTEGIAILMNNFIQNDTNTSTSSSNQQYSYINAICGQNFCVDTLTKRFNEAGGQVRCCKPNKNIFRYFWGVADRIPEVDLLKIRDITFRRLPV